MSFVYPAIERVCPDHFESELRNTVQFWGFYSRVELEANRGKLLMMDIDFGRRCSLRCPSCFRKQNRIDHVHYPDLTYDELLQTIAKATHLGLREVKVCGAGEPFENPGFLRFLQDLQVLGVGCAIFTKGHVLGDDELVKRYFSSEAAIGDGRDLCARLFELRTSLLVGFQSANPETQDRLVGGVRGYTTKRNRALCLLAEAGFNRTSPTRLALCTNPLTRHNFDEIFDIYVYARERNMLPVIAALMVSGDQIDSAFLLGNDVSLGAKEDLFAKIYEYNLTHGYSTLDRLGSDGISCMPGIHPCNQIVAGLYLTSNGGLLRCPGDCGESLGNVHDKDLSEIWEHNKMSSYSSKYNCGCPFKEGVTLSDGLYRNVYSRLSKLITAY